MADLQLLPRYRMRVYASDGTTVLTPAAGAPHSDAFQAATVSGLSGYQPYMQLPRGRRGSIDPMTRKLTVGTLTVDLLDKRTGTDNLSRWVTAYIGDAKGFNQLLGLKVVVEESVDGGGSWASYFVGQVRNAALVGRAGFRLMIRDRAQDLKRKVFVGQPHSAVTYANMANVIPCNGLTRAYGSYVSVPKLPMKVIASTLTGWGTQYYLYKDLSRWDPNDKNHQAWVLTVSAVIGANRTVPLDWMTQGAYLVRITRHDTSATGFLKLGSPQLPLDLSTLGVAVTGLPAYNTKRNDHGHEELQSIAVEALPAGHTGYIAMPADGVQVDVEVVPNLPPSDRFPLFVDRVHPVQLIQDLLAGYFGTLDSNGAVTWSIPTHSASFTALLADTTLRPLNFPRKKTQPLNEVVEAICQQSGLAHFLNRSGQVQLVDMRPQASSYGSVPTVTNADLVTATEPGWSDDADAAVTGLTLTYYQERWDGQLQTIAAAPQGQLVDVPPGAIYESDVQLVPFPYGKTGLSEETAEIDAFGFRVRADVYVTKSAVDLGEQTEVLSSLMTLARGLEGPMGYGVRTTTLKCRRTANVTGINPGDIRVLDIDEQPDPATNVRGGARVARALSVTENGPNLDVAFMDLGANSVALVPTVGAPALTAGSGLHSISVAITLNALTERARVDVAVTPTSTGSRPAEGSALWREMSRPTATGTVVINDMPAGERIWVRARTEPGPNDAPKLASAWAFPGSGTGYVDMTAIGAPTGGASSVLNGSEVVLTWTVADANLPLLLKLGSDTVEVIPEGSNRYTLRGLVASTAYTVTVQHVNPRNGATGATLSLSFTTGATPATAPTIVGLDILVGERV